MTMSTIDERDLEQYRMELARKMFETYKEQRRQYGEEPEYESFDNQPEYLKDSGFKNVDSMLVKVRYFGYHLEKDTGSNENVVMEFDARQIEVLSKLEHIRWMEERLGNGWVYGIEKDVERKVSPCLIPWEELPEYEKEKDRRVVRNVIPLFNGLGFVVCR